MDARVVARSGDSPRASTTASPPCSTRCESGEALREESRGSPSTPRAGCGPPRGREMGSPCAATRPRRRRVRVCRRTRRLVPVPGGRRCERWERARSGRARRGAGDLRGGAAGDAARDARAAEHARPRRCASTGREAARESRRRRTSAPASGGRERARTRGGDDDAPRRDAVRRERMRLSGDASERDRVFELRRTRGPAPACPKRFLPGFFPGNERARERGRRESEALARSGASARGFERLGNQLAELQRRLDSRDADVGRRRAQVEKKLSPSVSYRGSVPGIDDRRPAAMILAEAAALRAARDSVERARGIRVSRARRRRRRRGEGKHALRAPDASGPKAGGPSEDVDHAALAPYGKRRARRSAATRTRATPRWRARRRRGARSSPGSTSGSARFLRRRKRSETLRRRATRVRRTVEVYAFLSVFTINTFYGAVSFTGTRTAARSPGASTWRASPRGSVRSARRSPRTARSTFSR